MDGLENLLNIVFCFGVATEFFFSEVVKIFVCNMNLKLLLMLMPI